MTRDQAHDYGRLCAAIAALRAIRDPVQDEINAAAMLERLRDRHDDADAAEAGEDGRDG